jgi:hypothetical protein
LRIFGQVPLQRCALISHSTWEGPTIPGGKRAPLTPFMSRSNPCRSCDLRWTRHLVCVSYFYFEGHCGPASDLESCVKDLGVEEAGKPNCSPAGTDLRKRLGRRPARRVLMMSFICSCLHITAKRPNSRRNIMLKTFCAQVESDQPGYSEGGYYDRVALQSGHLDLVLTRIWSGLLNSSSIELWSIETLKLFGLLNSATWRCLERVSRHLALCWDSVICFCGLLATCGAPVL